MGVQTPIIQIKDFCYKKVFYKAEAFRKKVTIMPKIHLKILWFLKALQENTYIKYKSINLYPLLCSLYSTKLDHNSIYQICHPSVTLKKYVHT